jgi:hypothetical protein
MKNAGISSAAVQDIIGHESAAISANYTHIDEETKRSALSALFRLPPAGIFAGARHVAHRSAPEPSRKKI